jgi:hypothetical protein
MLQFFWEYVGKRDGGRNRHVAINSTRERINENANRNSITVSR